MLRPLRLSTLRPSSARLILAISIASVLAQSGQAQTTWTNNSGAGNAQWSTATNWSAGEPLSTTAVTFPSVIPTGGGTVTLATNEVANSLAFQNAYTLSSGSLTITSGDITVDSGVTATINSVIQGATGMTKLGTGVLVLGGNNTLTNTIEINEGTLRISSINNINVSSPVAVTLGTSTTVATFDYAAPSFATGRTFTLGSFGANTINVATAGQTLTLNAAVSGGVANAPDANTLGNTALIISGLGRLEPKATNTFTGNIVVDQATLVFDNNDARLGATASGAFKSVILRNGGTFNQTTGTYNPTNGSGTTANKRFVIDTGGGTLDIASGATLQLDDANQMSGTGTLTKAGGGLVILSSQVFNLTGAINLNAGTLRATGNAGVLGGIAVNAPVTVASGAVFDLQTALTSARPVTISGSGISNGGALINASTSGAVGSLVIAPTLAGDITFGGGGGITLPSLNGGNATRTITKVGTGTVAFTGAGTGFTGTTSVTITDGELFFGTASALGGAATITATGTAAGVVQNGAAAGYTYTVATNGLIGGDKAFLDSLVIGTNLNTLPETLVQTAADVLETTTLSIPNSADRFFGIGADLTESVTVGTGTPWKGVSNDNRGRRWLTGTITANSNFELRATNGTQVNGTNQLLLGNGTTAGSVTIASAGAVTAKVIGGNVALDDDTPGYTSNLTFEVANGASLQTVTATALGANATAANNARVNVLSGGYLNPNAGATVSGNATIRQGGLLLLDDASNLSGIGTITQEPGAITRITNATGNTGSQSPGTVPGSIIRVEVNVTNLNTNFDDAANYVITGGNRSVSSFALTSVGEVALPGGGMTPTGILTNDGLSRTMNNTGTGTVNTITIGTGGATIAASTGTTFSIAPITGNTTGGTVFNAGANKLTIGSTATIDGQAKAGIVDLSGINASGIVAGSVDIVSGTLQNLSGGMTYSIGGGTGVTRVFSGATFSSGTGTISSTHLQVDSGATARWTISSGNAQVSALSGAGNAILGPATADAVSRTLTIGSNNQSTTFSGVISQNLTGAATGSIVKTGNGTLTLSGVNTYTGTTTVNAGTLLVHGSIADSAATVNSGGTLGGGTAIAPGLTGAVTVNTGGTLAPGSSIGSLQTGALNFGAGATLALEINTTSSTADLLASSGAFTLSLANDTLLTIDDLAPVLFESGGFTVLTYNSGGWNGGLFKYGGTAIPDGGQISVEGNQFTLDYDAGGNSVTLVAVPEPSTALSIFGGIGMLLGLRRRRQS